MRLSLWIGPLLAGLLAGSSPAPANAEPIRASYFYSYQSASHIDSLAAAGFNRAIAKCIHDSLAGRGATELGRLLDRGKAVGIEVVPEWSLQATSRLNALPTTRRYTWGKGTVEAAVGCPLDSLFWSSAFRDRAVETLAAFPQVSRLVIDLEIYTGSRHHYDAGPCRCAACLGEFARVSGTAPDLSTFEEKRLAAFLEPMLRELTAMRPGLALEFFDLDFDSFVHRAMIQALKRARVPTANYTERTYKSGAASIPAARAPLDALGLSAPLVCGIHLKGFAPPSLSAAVAGLLAASEGYFVFTSYSLWQPDSTQLTGPYALRGSQADYWNAFRKINRGPRPKR